MRRLLLPLYVAAVGAALTLGLRWSPILTARAMQLTPPAETIAAQPVPFTVAEGAAPGDIAASLRDAMVIDDVRRFHFLLGLDGTGRDLRAGCYLFVREMTAGEAVYRLRSGITSAQLFAIPEGRRLEEVGSLIERASITSSAQWQAALAAAPRDQIPGPPSAPRSLLGYLLPASYPLQCKANANTMVAAMLKAFADQVTPDIVAAINAQGLTLDEGITLASIVEREAVLKPEQGVIAAVFLNRLRTRIPLQADPTVQFALANARPPSGDATWWKTALLDTDLQVDSPYNTYRHAGLPPGPIANPGIDAIRAVAFPAQTDYLYFVARGDGSHAFGRTLAEHNANVARFQPR